VHCSGGKSTAVRSGKREEKCAPRGAADIPFVRQSRIKENAFLRREKHLLAFAASAPETI
jgi:hypothetical protein